MPIKKIFEYEGKVMEITQEQYNAEGYYSNPSKRKKVKPIKEKEKETKNIDGLVME